MCGKEMLTAKLPFGQKEIIPRLDERAFRPALEFKSWEPCTGLWTISLCPVFSCQLFFIPINGWAYSASGSLDNEHIPTNQEKHKHVRTVAYFKNSICLLSARAVHLWRPAPHLKRGSSHPETGFVNQLQNSNCSVTHLSYVREKKGEREREILMTPETSICVKAETSKIFIFFLGRRFW